MATPLTPLIAPRPLSGVPAAQLTESQRRIIAADNVALAEELSPSFTKSPSLCYKISSYAYSTTGLFVIAGIMVGIILLLLLFPEMVLFVRYLGSPCMEIWTNAGQHYYKCRYAMPQHGHVHNPPPVLH